MAARIGADRRGRVGGRGARRQSLSTQTTILLVCLVPAALVLLPTCILLVVAMLPTAVAFYVDRDPARYLAYSVGLLNLCGAVFSIAELWSLGHTLRASVQVLGDVYTWLIAYSGAACGWLIYLGMPSLITRLAAAKQAHRLAQLRARQADLVETWGEAVAESPAEPTELAAASAGR